MTSTSRRTRRRSFGTFGSVAVAALLSITPVWASPTVSAAPATASTDLARGARGEAVMFAQQALQARGIAVPGGIDGVFGAATESAVKEFQGRNGLSPTGVIDSATSLALGLTSSPMFGLSRGDRSEAVRTLQQRLASSGLDVPGGADGVFGAGTEAAVKAFQKAHGLPQSGVVTAETAAALGGIVATPPALPAGGAAVESPAARQSSDTNARDEGQDDPADEVDPADEGDTGQSQSMLGLKVGSRGAAVTTMQRTIMHAGFTVVGGADGVFGALTANALKSFQNANGITPTGVVDEATERVLLIVGTGDNSGDSSGNDSGPDSGHDPTVTSPLLGLQFGAIGADVVALQDSLARAGHRPRGGSDGVFGAATTTAVKAFQTARGLSVTGKVDQATADALAGGAGGGSTANPTLVGLKAGDLGNTVKQLQQALEQAGHRPRGGADGIFGPATAQALQAFQNAQGLSVTGTVDAATAAALANPSPTTPNSVTSTDGFAVYGERGVRVLSLQQALVEAGISVRGGVDGDFGGGTAAAVMDFQRREGLAVTGKVDATTAAKLGLEPTAKPPTPDATSIKLDVFPMQGRCSYIDTWQYPRGGGRRHLGVDIIGAEGLALYAVTDGTIDKVYHDYPGSLAGNGLRLRLPDGTYFFYAHLSAFADGIEAGVPVKAGQTIGYNGTTGNSGTPHLHLEIHPGGGSAINPYPLVKAIDGCSDTELLPQP